MQEKEFKELLKSGRLGGAFLFTGEEDYLKRHYLSLLRRAIVTDEAFAPFNHSVYDGQDVSLASILDAVKAPPVFADYKLIEWRFPSFNKMKESDLSALEDILGALPDYDYTALAIIVADGEIDLGTDKKPSKLRRRLEKEINILNFPASTDSALLSWMKRHFDHDGIAVSAEALNALLFRSGHSMDVLNNEITKLVYYLKANGRSSLTAEDVSSICSSTTECDSFALTNALLEKNKRAAYLALEELKTERLDPQVILGMIAKTYSELTAITLLKDEGLDQASMEKITGIHPYKVKSYIRSSRLFKPGAPKAILEELSRVDVGMKFGGVMGYTAIEMFIAKCV